MRYRRGRSGLTFRAVDHRPPTSILLERGVRPDDLLPVDAFHGGHNFSSWRSSDLPGVIRPGPPGLIAVANRSLAHACSEAVTTRTTGASH